MLERGQVEAYWRDGFTLARGLFSEAEIEPWLRRTRDHYANAKSEDLWGGVDKLAKRPCILMRGEGQARGNG